MPADPTTHARLTEPARPELSATARFALPIQTDVGNYLISNYPPYSCWTQGQIPEFLRVLERPYKSSALGLYVHLPFCRQRCQYCYFRVYPQRTEEETDRYLDGVLKELAFYRIYPAFQERSLRSVYFGGGSPSYLSSQQIRRLLGGLQEQWGWDKVEECTFECEPGSVDLEKFRTLKELGVTRVSLGFQSLNNEVLRRNGRAARVADCLRSYELARLAGFEEINIDLLAGLTGETDQSWRRTIDGVLALAPDCVTIYQLELSYNSRLFGAMKSGHPIRLPTWPQKRRWVGQAFSQFEEAGYVIGSGYMAIRHPQLWRFVYTVEQFWHGADLLALGDSAFGHLQGVHYQNVDRFDRYLELLQEGKLPLGRALRLTREEQLRREVVLQLKTGALDARYFREKFGIELTAHFAVELEELRRRQLLDTELKEQLLWIQKFHPSVLVGRPSQLRDLAKVAEESGIFALSLGVEKLVLTGEPSWPHLKPELEQLWGARCFDRYGMTEAGSIAGECGAHAGGLHLLDDQFIAEVIDLKTSQRLKDRMGSGELVLTNLGRACRPIIRYRTGDLVRIVPRHECACGRTGVFLAGGVQRAGSSAGSR